MQTEVIFNSVYLRCLQSRETSVETKELVLESLLDFCRLPFFFRELYLNYDCDLRFTDLCHNLVSQVSQLCFPTTLASSLSGNALAASQGGAGAGGLQTNQNGSGMDAGGDSMGASSQPPLGSLHLLALHCLLYAQHALVTRAFVPLTALTPSQKSALTASQISAAQKSGSVPPSLPAELSSWPLVKSLKCEYAACADEFNRKPKKGLARMAAAGIADVWHEDATTGKLMAPPPAEIAKLALFLRQTPGLNKAALGDFLGANNDVGKATLTAMVALFDFRALTVDQALRVFLEAFRLPGEAQQIDRIVQVWVARGGGAEAFGLLTIRPSLVWLLA